MVVLQTLNKVIQTANYDLIIDNNFFTVTHSFFM